MRVKRFAQILLAVQAVMVVALGFSTVLLERRLELLNDSRDVAFQSYLLADELRQSSDDLTRLARTFVVTGDPEFEREYRAVVGIRNGELPRPGEYHRLYWDLVTAENREPRPPGPAAPLRQLMIAAGFTAAELAKLDEAQRHSDALVRTETIAMNAAKGRFADGSGSFTLERAPDRELAVRLMHDDAYRDAKRRIMQPIDEFYAMFEARTQGAVGEFLAQSRSQLRWLSLLLAATLALFVGSFLALLWQNAQREAAQRALAESEARYRTIFQTAADGFALVDKQARLLEVNEALCRMSGYSTEELRSMRISDLEASETEHGISQHLEHVRAHTDERFSARLVRRGGAIVDVEISAQYRAIDTGRFVVIVRDVTALKQALAAQRESEEMLLSAFSASPAAIWISEGQDARACVAVNDAFESMTGFSKADVIGKTGDEISLYEDSRDRERLVEKLRESGGFRNAELRFRKKDGELRDGLFNAQVSRVGDKDYVLVVLTDVTDAKRAQRELQQLAENISDVISTLNLETERFEYVSPSVLRLRGYTPEEATGQRLDAVLTAESLTHARHRIVELVLAEKEGREPAAGANDGSIVYHQICKGGGTVPTEVRARIVRDPTSGKPLLLSVSRDVSERLKAEKDRGELQQQLYQSQKMEAIGGLAGGIAHDFNNLLSVIMSYTDFVVDKLPEDDRRRSDLVEVQKASDRAASLVRQLLAFSRKQILEPRVIDLNQVVGGVEKMLRRLVGEDIRLEVTLAEDLGTVLADAGQIDQVLMNLVVNARDAMPRGGRLAIQTRNTEVAENGAPQPSDVKPGRYVTFTVADSGSGMDEATLARAFEPFFTTKGLGKGTGLGLSTVYGIVKQSDGEVRVASTLGVGTTFTVYLPRQDAPPSERQVPKSVPSAGSGGETVLVVEDEDGMRTLIARILRNAGYTVLAAENGSDALALFDAHGGKVDLLVTDVVMPQMSGREIAEQIARKKPAFKVLYMSGYTDEIIDRHGVLEPGVRLIGKPFAAAELTRRVRMVLDEESGGAA